MAGIEGNQSAAGTDTDTPGGKSSAAGTGADTPGGNQSAAGTGPAFLQGVSYFQPVQYKVWIFPIMHECGILFTFWF